MSSEWPVLALEDCLDALIDYRGKTPTKTDSGVPLVTAKVIKGGRIETPNEFIAEQDFNSWMRRGMPQPGDVVMTTEAPLGEVAQLGRQKVALAQRVITLRGKAGFLDNDYLLYLMMSEEMQDQLKARATGTTVLGIKQSELRKITLKVPPLEIQREAASMLKTLDDRIALLRETNTTLEAIAQALFKSWFVDFDPVHANAGTQAPSLPAEIQALFPSRLVESPQGLIPEGWEVKALDDIAEFLNGLALQKYPPSGVDDLPVIKIAQLRKGDTEGAALANSNIKPEYVITDGDVLFSWSGSLLVDIWCGGKGALNQHLFKVMSSIFPKWFYYLWTKHHLPHFQQIAESKATTMGHIQRKHLSESKVLVPPQAILDEADKALSPILEQIINNSIQARDLANLRDTLLPRLISGQLRLPEAEAALAEVGR